MQAPNATRASWFIVCTLHAQSALTLSLSLSLSLSLCLPPPRSLPLSTALPAFSVAHASALDDRDKAMKRAEKAEALLRIAEPRLYSGTEFKCVDKQNLAQ
jgi:hypothetical protein